METLLGREKKSCLLLRKMDKFFFKQKIKVFKDIVNVLI